MKRGILIILFIGFAILIVGGFFVFKSKSNLEIPYNESLSADKQIDYLGEQTTIMHRDFKAIIKKDWQELEIPPSTYLYFPKETSKDDKNAEIISIVVSYLEENNSYTLESFLEKGLENSKQIIPDFELIENIDKENEYFSGKRIRFSGTSESVKRNFVQFFGIKYNNLYVISYSCPIENCNSYAIYNSLVESFEPIIVEIKT